MPSATATAPTKSQPEELATADERAAAGKAAREKTSRASHGDWAPAARRRDPVKVLEDQSKGRVQELVPIPTGGCWPRPLRSTAVRRRSWIGCIGSPKAR